MSYEYSECDRYPQPIYATGGECVVTANPLHHSMRRFFDDCFTLSVAKNADYASDDDPLKNFRKSPEFGVPLPLGIMVRMSDKWSRLESLISNPDGAQVADEKIEDTLRDLANYAAILAYALEEGK